MPGCGLMGVVGLLSKIAFSFLADGVGSEREGSTRSRSGHRHHQPAHSGRHPCGSLPYESSAKKRERAGHRSRRKRAERRCLEKEFGPSRARVCCSCRLADILQSGTAVTVPRKRPKQTSDSIWCSSLKPEAPQPPSPLGMCIQGNEHYRCRPAARKQLGLPPRSAKRADTQNQRNRHGGRRLKRPKPDFKGVEVHLAVPCASCSAELSCRSCADQRLLLFPLNLFSLFPSNSPSPKKPVPRA
ncbi:hypothetical protein FN846DRAFT_528650 [Sphaerosporella brunnea]|uniref:Secreted protein n=1 Tax=Sphaerosporella brunnea TaxID=1250544 RepID=A0A5J5EEI1_9PEZI|nr:hypothetical protein FN846DRAFT_528650 [Sphaerosporella brunnea]